MLADDTDYTDALLASLYLITAKDYQRHQVNQLTSVIVLLITNSVK